MNTAVFTVVARAQVQALQQVAQSINNMTRAVQQLQAASGQQAAGAARATAGIQNAGGAARAATGPFSGLRNALAGAAQGYQGLANQANASANNVVQANQRIASGGNQIRSLGATGVLAGFAASTGLALKRTTDQAVDFDSTMRNVNTISRLSEGAFQTLAESVLSLAGSAEAGGQKASDLALALYDVFSAGIGVDASASEAENLDAALNVARLSALGASAGLATTAQTAGGFLKVINAFGLQRAPIGDLTGVMDAMFESVNAGIFTFPELAGAIGVVSGPAHQAGLSINEMLAALAQSSRQTQDVQASAYGLGQVLITLTNAKGPAQDMWNTIAAATGHAGEALDITTLKAKGFEQFLLDIITASGQYAEQTGVDIGDVLDKIDGGARSLRTFTALANDGGREFSQMLEQISHAGSITSGPMKGLSATTAAYTEQLKSTKKQQDIAGASMERLGIVAGRGLLPQLTGIAQSTKQFADAVSNLPEPVLKAAGSALFLVGSITGLIAAARLARLALGVFAGPLGIALFAAAAAAAIAFSTNFLGIRDIIMSAVDNLGRFKDAAGEVLDVITGRAPEAGGALRAIFGPAAQSQAEAFMRQVGHIREAVVGFQEGFARPTGYQRGAQNPAAVGGSATAAAMFELAQRLKKAWDDLRPTFDAIGRSAQGVIDAFSRAFGRFFDYLVNHGDDISRTVGGVLDKLLPIAETLGAALSRALDFLALVIDKAADFIGWLNEGSLGAELLKAALAGVALTVVVGMIPAIVAMTLAWAAAAIAAGAAAVAMIIAIAPVALPIIAIGAAIYLIIRYWDDLVAVVKKWLPVIAAWFINFLAGPLNMVIKLLNGFIQGLVWLAKLVHIDIKIPLIPEIDGNKIVAAAQDAIDRANGVVVIPTAVADTAHGAATRLGALNLGADAPQNAALARRQGSALGEDIASGVVGGIDRRSEAVATAGRGLVERGIDRMRAAADAHSPSAATIALGQDMADGLVVGLNSAAADSDLVLTSLRLSLSLLSAPMDLVRASAIALFGALAATDEQFKLMRKNVDDALAFWPQLAGLKVEGGTLSAQWQGFWDGLAAAATGAWLGLTGAWTGLWAGVGAIWDGFTSGLAGGWGGFWSGLGGIAGGVWSGISGAWSGLWDGIGKAWDGASSSLGAAWSGFWDGVGSAAAGVWAGLSEGWAGLMAGIASAWADFSAGFAKGWSEFWGGVGTTANGIWLGIVAAWQGFWDGLGLAWTTFTTWLGGVWGGFWQGLGDAATGIWSWVSEKWDGLWSNVRATWDRFSAWLGERWAAVFGPSGWIARTDLWRAGWDIVQGLWNGFVAKWNEFTANAAALVAGLSPIVKKIFGIQSPSSVFAEIGAQIPAGLALGIASGRGDVEAAMAGMLGSAGTPIVGGLDRRTEHRISIDVTSSDGSVSGLQLDQARQVFERAFGEIIGDARRIQRAGA